MSILNLIFGEPEIRSLKPSQKAEVNQFVDRLVIIGKQDDFLSLTPGGPFDYQCHHREAKEIGRQLHSIGGIPLMYAVRNVIKRKLKSTLAEHLDHAWKGVGDWKA
jgi:hypothetical protein